MRVSVVWFEFFDGLFNVQMCDMSEVNVTTRGKLNRAHLFPKLLRYKRGSDITEVIV